MVGGSFKGAEVARLSDRTKVHAVTAAAAAVRSSSSEHSDGVAVVIISLGVLWRACAVVVR